MRILVSAFFFLVLFSQACKNKSAPEVKKQVTHQNKPVPTDNVNKDSLLTKLSYHILLAIKIKKYDSLEKFIHPVEGLRLSPYAYIDTLHDIVLSHLKFAEEAKNKKQDKILWGLYDGSGEPILMTLNEYMKKFVYDADFLNPEKFEINKFIGSGNSINNVLSVYKNCDFTESHFSGFDKKYEGMDWRSLRLVFKKFTDNYYLVAIIHDQWTI
jgi:hypothetical protein